MEVLDRGDAEFHFVDPDDFREYVRDRKNRNWEDKLMDESEAVKKFVSDGDYLAYDFSSLTRGPQSLIREIIRQRKKYLWICAKFTLLESVLLAGAGCIDKIDVGFLGFGPYIARKVQNGEVKVYDWSNGSITYRLIAGAMGVPFIPARDLLGTDTFKKSGAMAVKDPFTGKPVALLPALNPDVAIIHVQEADIYGNARVYGPTVATLETAMASKKVIISAERIVETIEFRKEPNMTIIPYYLVDAVVHAPFGAYPGGTQGYYEMDSEHYLMLSSIREEEDMQRYLEEYIYSVDSHEEFLEKRVGMKKLKELIKKAQILEGYR
ncbi:Acyl CoA:acetate/3-ketoacid CoA transferase, alpha subunit [Geoglobus ahangari]|uniref:Acyl CoA:acetate/3-ketoacid CoA transferase, alpha subunit n=1 Tax=Geoglobus ahangari TaxID=113653 RepID=A0A0F7IFU8_9EURY|nr:CoA-transferase [Geoglobus ahangari]AKG91380.1 Acyl CoA:acetate/3-ketoacid CoA transferase, alpha subunit [Geoglobus ahangari]